MSTESKLPGARSSPASDHEIRMALGRASRAILVSDDAGRVRLANQAAHDLFGYAEPHLVGMGISHLVPGAFRDRQAGLRSVEQAVVPADATPITHHARRSDGSRFAVHLSRRPLHFQGAVMLLATVQPCGVDAPAEADESAARPDVSDQLLRLDDLLLQDLTVALWGLEAGDLVSTRRLVAHAVERAREMQRLLAPAPTGARSEAHPIIAASSPHSRRTPLVRVVLADDTDEIRDALRRYLDRHPGVEVVGEAVDGAHAIDVARALQPDLVLLDYSMPVMDGLEALPKIRAAAPAAKVIMLSSYSDDVIGDAAMHAGAMAYVEKGGARCLKQIVGLIERQFLPDAAS